MKTFDAYQLDGQTIRTFLVILEVSSVSKAAEHLGVTQSAVSHTLSKLRRILCDPLFIRSGQGISPTEMALSLKAPAQDILDRMKALSDQRPFDPTLETMAFTVAANDMQRDLVFPELIRSALAEEIDLGLKIVPSGVPSVAMLRDARCDLMLTPLPPDAPDLVQRKLFTGQMRLFFDAACADPPRTVEAYLSAQHIGVQFALGGASSEVLKSRELPSLPAPRVNVSNFSGIPPFVKGTKLIATQLEFLRHTSLRDLAHAPLPFASEPVSVYMVWHQRSTNDPAHKWLRKRTFEIASSWSKVDAPAQRVG